MWITRNGDSPAIHIASLIQIAQFFKRLTTVIVGGGIFRIGREKRLELPNGASQVARFDVLHRQAVADEGVGGILGEQLAQDIEPGIVHNVFQSVRIQP